MKSKLIRLSVFAAGLTFIAFGLFWPMPARSATLEPICRPITARFVCSAEVSANACDASNLYISAMIATNGNCAARRTLDDDLFVPLLGVVFEESLKGATGGEIYTAFSEFMPKFRRDLARLSDDGSISAKDAMVLDGLARKIQRVK